MHISGPLHDHFATTYGLHRDSSLNTSSYFHVTEGLVPDVMHDCLEGCLPHETKELLKYLFRSNILTLSSLNEAMESFPYAGSDSRNRPSLLFHHLTMLLSKKVRHTHIVIFSCVHMYVIASQMWCLGRLLPFFVGEKVPLDDPYWENFLLLRKILDYVLAPTLSLDCIGYLKSLINDHHITFKELYPHSPLILKSHYLIHYPDIMERLVDCLSIFV